MKKVRWPGSRIWQEVSIEREFNGVSYTLLVWTTHNMEYGKPKAEWVTTDSLDVYEEVN